MEAFSLFAVYMHPNVWQKIVNIFVLLPLFVLSGLVIAGSLTLVIKSDFEKPFPDILCALACLSSILLPLSFMGMTGDVANLLYLLGLYGTPLLIFLSLIFRDVAILSRRLELRERHS